MKLKGFQTPLIIQAIQFASEKHKNQVRRGSGLPYVTHPIIVSELIRKYKGNSVNIEALICAALLHDTLEDTDTNYHEIERLFGTLVASLVFELTSDEVAIEKMGKNEYLMQKMVTMSSYGLVCKLCDRLSNIIDGPTDNYLKDTRKMMEYIYDNRKDITETQKDIMLDIYAVLVTRGF